MSRFGLVTVLYNSIEVLDAFFASLAAQDHKDWFIEIVDNSPGPEVIERARALAEENQIEQISFLYNGANLGVAEGNNQGIERALAKGCDYVILLNNDIEFSAGLLAEIDADIAQNGAAIIAPRILYYDSPRVWFGGGSINEFSAVSKHRGEGAIDSAAFHVSGPTAYAPTCFLAVRTDVFARVGLMDAAYFVYYDDTDFVHRCNRASYTIRYLGSSCLYHKVSSSTGGKTSRFSIFYYNRNRLYYMRKHISATIYPLSLAWYLVTRLYKYLIYAPDQRESLIKAVRAGFAMPLHKIRAGS